MASEDARDGGGVGRPCLVTAGVAHLPREAPPARLGHYPTTASPAIAAVELAIRPSPSGEENQGSSTVALLTVKQVAERLNISAGTLYALCAGRKLEHVRVGAGRGTLRIEEQALLRFVQGATIGPEESTAPHPHTPAPKRPVVTLKHLSLS